MSNEDNDLTKRKTKNPTNCEMIKSPCDWENSTSTNNSTGNFGNFSDIIVDGLVKVENNNCDEVIDTSSSSTNANNTIRTLSPTIVQGLPETPLWVTCTSSNEQKQTNLSINITSGGNEGSSVDVRNRNENLINQLLPQQNNNCFTLQSVVSLQSPRNSYSSLEGTGSLESASSTVSFVTEIEVIPRKSIANSSAPLFSLQYEHTRVNMEESAESSNKPDSSTGKEVAEPESEKPSDTHDGESGNQDGGDDEEQEVGAASTAEDDEGMGIEGEGEDDEDDDTTTLSSEAVVDDIELILMPEMCQDFTQANISPKLVRVTELRVNVDDVFCDDEDDQSSRHEFRSIVDDVCEEDDAAETPQEREDRLSMEDDEVSSGSELISVGRKKGVNRSVSGGGGESSSKSSSSSGRRRRSTSGRISSGVQTEITALEEPTALSGHQGFWRKPPGKSASGRLGIPSSQQPGTSGKKLNWKSELTLLPSKMKVKQTGYNSFESNDERDQYSPRVAKFTSQDTLNLSSQFLKPSTLYRTRNLSRNLNQFASSESTFMLPMSSEQQLSAESPRFRDRVSSSTSGGVGNFKGTSTSYSAYQISSILSGGGSGTVGGIGCSAGYGYGSGLAPVNSARRQPSMSSYSGGAMMMGLSGCSSRHFRSSMPDLNAVNKSYAAAAASMADSHRRRPPSKSIKHHSSSGFRLQKRSSSDEETSSLIDESERCLRSSIDLLLTDELPSPGGDSCFRSTGFGLTSYGGLYSSSRRFCSQPILNDQAYPPEMRDPSMGSPFLPRKLSDMRCSRWAKVILPNGHVAVVAVKETDEIQDTLTVHTDTGCVINIPFRKVVFAWKSRR